MKTRNSFQGRDRRWRIHKRELKKSSSFFCVSGTSSCFIAGRAFDLPEMEYKCERRRRRYAMWMGGHGQAGADEGRQHFLICGAEIASLELVWDIRMEKWGKFF